MQHDAGHDETHDDLRLRHGADPRSGICRYEISPGDTSSLEFEIRGLHGCYDRYRDTMTKPHHCFCQVLWCQRPGRHFVAFAGYRHDADAFFFVAGDRVHHFKPEVVPEQKLLHLNAAYLGAVSLTREGHLGFHLFDSLHRKPMIQPQCTDLSELKYGIGGIRARIRGGVPARRAARGRRAGAASRPRSGPARGESSHVAGRLDGPERRDAWTVTTCAAC